MLRVIQNQYNFISILKNIISLQQNVTIEHTNLTVVFVLAKRAATDVVAVVVFVFTGVVVFRLSRYKQR